LSRPPAEAAQPPAVGAVVPPASTGPLSWEDIAAGQSTCEELPGLLDSSSLKLRHVSMGEVQVWCDTSTDVLRPVIARRQRRHVFENVHQLAHAGIQGGPYVRTHLVCRRLTTFQMISGGLGLVLWIAGCLWNNII